MAVKTELIARLLAQVEDFQRQLARVVVLLQGHNSPPRTLRRLRFENVTPNILNALQVSKDFEKAFCAIEIPPIKIPDWIAKPED